MKTVRDFQAANPNRPAVIFNHLTNVERVLHELSLSWEHVPAESWVTVYERLALSAPAMCRRYHSACTSFYQWLVDIGEMNADQCTYFAFTPVLGGNISIRAAQRFLPHVETLLALLDRSRTAIRATPANVLQSRHLQVCLLWYQLSLPEIAGLRLPNIRFFLPSGAEADALLCYSGDLSHATLRCVGVKAASSKECEHTYTIQNSLALRLLLEVYRTAVRAESSEHLFSVDGHAFQPDALRVIITRTIGYVNRQSGLMLTPSSIQESGLYFKAYTYWQYHHLPFVYTPAHADQLYQLLGRSLGERTHAKQSEFLKFLTYVREVQKQPI